MRGNGQIERLHRTVYEAEGYQVHDEEQRHAAGTGIAYTFFGEGKRIAVRSDFQVSLRQGIALLAFPQRFSISWHTEYAPFCTRRETSEPVAFRNKAVCKWLLVGSNRPFHPTL